jgi:putative alpha-1,2-mannosidase
MSTTASFRRTILCWALAVLVVGFLVGLHAATDGQNTFPWWNTPMERT